MSDDKIAEIERLRAELEEKQRSRAEAAAASAQEATDKAHDIEIARLNAEIANEEAIQALIAGTGQKEREEIVKTGEVNTAPASTPSRPNTVTVPTNPTGVVVNNTNEEEK